MLNLKDILSVLDRWEVWQVLRENADKVPDLERRIVDLEEKLGGKWPCDVCPKCGMLTLRVVRTHRVKDRSGAYRSLRSYACEEDGCDFKEQRQV
ncbi:MAG: hypothetical protein V3U60_16590 [Gammaproteobacteria bacterium]